MSYSGYKKLCVEKQDKILIIKFNNPRKKNCIDFDGYKELTRVLTEANGDDSLTIVVITGEGEYFTAGNDMTPSSDIVDMEAHLKDRTDVFNAMVISVINCTKLIFSLVNGPAIGIGATIAGISDVAWCAEEAYFQSPFTKLGLVPEACSSFTFPLIMGRSKATEMLVLNEKLSAQEAFHFNFVSRVFKLSDLETVIWPKIFEYSKLPPNSLRESKRLIVNSMRESLLRSNDTECEALYKRMNSEECMHAIINFLTRKSKL